MVECPALPPIPNGVISYAPDMTPDYNVDTVATHTCNPGYLLLGPGLGPDTRQCFAGGTWSGVTPVCVGT